MGEGCLSLGSYERRARAVCSAGPDAILRAVPAEQGPSFRERSRRWLKWALVIVGGIAVVLIGGRIAGAFFPRWWSHRIGDQVDGSMVAGIALGLFYGFVFVALPVLLLRWAFRRRRHWKVWVACVVLALILALPDLLTLGIVLGHGKAAHAGERTLDVEAPGFRTSSLIGAIVFVLAWGMFEYVLISRWFARRREHRLRAKLDAEHAAHAAAPASDTPPVPPTPPA
jgi:uncharacterized protein (DUF2062 family)